MKSGIIHSSNLILKEKAVLYKTDPLEKRGVLFEPIQTERDLTLYRTAEGYLVIACDSSGSIGEKETDRLRVAPSVSGRFALRVCLNEILSVGALPLCVVSAVCNEWEPTGTAIFKGIKLELDRFGFGDLPINGSTEENFPTAMTAFGITVIGWAKTLHFRKTRSGDTLYLFGSPRVGQAVLENENTLLDPAAIQRLFQTCPIGDLLPCGSRGIRHEIAVLMKETGLWIRLERPLTIDIDRSAGPSTCAIFTSGDKVAPLTLPSVSIIGTVE